VLGGLIAVVLIVIIGFALRGKGTAPADVTPPALLDEDAFSEGAVPDDLEDDLVDGEGDDEVVAVTIDGFAIVPDAHAVRYMPPDEDGEAWKAGSLARSARNARGGRALDMSWHAGDFTGARIVRGDADEGPWRLEAMGRDGEYTAFVFETREGADAALKAFESRGVIRLGRDEDGNTVPPSAEQFAEARRVFLETEAALDADEEDER
jgi:hypothetical protein